MLNRNAIAEVIVTGRYTIQFQAATALLVRKKKLEPGWILAIIIK